MARSFSSSSRRRIDRGRTPLRRELKCISKKILAVAVASTVTIEGMLVKVVSDIAESSRVTDSAELGMTI